MEAISLVDFAAQTQDKMKKGLVLKVTNESVFLRILRFVMCDGFAYKYPEMTKLPGVAFRKLNGDYEPDSGVVNPKEEKLAIFGGIVQTDHQLAQLRDGVVRTNAILGKVRAAGLFYDRYCIWGNPDANAAQFWGLFYRITGNQVLTNADNGATLAMGKGLDGVNALLDAVAGPNSSKVLIMNKNVRRQMKAEILASAGGAGLADVSGSLDSYDGARIEVLDEDGDETPILPFTETCGEAEDTVSMYCIRPGQDAEGEMVQGLMGRKMIEQTALAQVDTKVQDLVEMLGGLGVFHGRAAARLKGIKAI